MPRCLTGKKVVLVSLCIVLCLAGFWPQVAHASAYERAVAEYEAETGLSLADRESALAAAGTNILELAAAFTNPALGLALSASEAPAPAQARPAPPGLPVPLGSASSYGTPVDLDELLDPLLGDEGEHGLLLVTKEDTCTAAPKDHYELVQCVEHQSQVDPALFGASTVTGIDQTVNPHSQDDTYTSYYTGFFYAVSPGTWQFQTTSDDSSEIEIDGIVVAGVYRGDGQNGATGSPSGSIELDSGWHHIVYRHRVSLRLGRVHVSAYQRLAHVRRRGKCATRDVVAL